ncbi:uncharacterized protein LOC130733837 [Lotus japonicus]|uniref:uncharacterized protein LOC130733837 n=1 Tax=Lotus japonicus TaxID=34305 RepID=UPI0025858190|nr:uncharacterized protein LOC130733837 [Lotus japonicus]
MRLTLASFAGVVFGFFLGVSSPTLSLTKMNLPSSIFPSIDLTFVEDSSKIPTKPIWDAWSSFRGDRSMSHELPKLNETKIWVPTNPHGAERLPPRIVESQSDLYLRQLWGLPDQDLSIKPKYLVTFTLRYDQRSNIDAAIKKFAENFTIVLFHYDGRASEWDNFEWSKKAIHISVRKQTKWWYAKRFLHPYIVAPYDYIFIWDEDLGLDHFDAEEDKKKGWCPEPNLPPCAAFVEIMAPVFSRDAWRCVWHMIQHDLIHGWGLDFALRKCVETPHKKIGVVDAQWIVHQSVPSLGNQGQAETGRAPWEGVRERCKKEWTMFQERMANAEKDYFQGLTLNSTRS